MSVCVVLKVAMLAREGMSGIVEGLVSASSPGRMGLGRSPMKRSFEAGLIGREATSGG
jgi:hypothetical protein